MRPRRNRSESGYVLVTMAGTSFALLAGLGLAVDIGRMFIAKNETQAYCDSAAMAATLRLNGASTGITAATNAVANSTNSWNLDTAAITNYTVDFATSATGPWSTNPGSPADFRFVRVQATVPVQMFFLPAVVPKQSQDVSSITIAAQIPENCFVSPPCSGDSASSKAAVTQYWGASINGYWGSNANSTIDQEVLDN